MKEAFRQCKVWLEPIKNQSKMGVLFFFFPHKLKRKVIVIHLRSPQMCDVIYAFASKSTSGVLGPTFTIASLKDLLAFERLHVGPHLLLEGINGFTQKLKLFTVLMINVSPEVRNCSTFRTIQL